MLDPDRVSQRIHGACRLRRMCAGMNANPAEVMPKARFHETARSIIDGLPVRTQDFMNDWRSEGRFGTCLLAAKLLLLLVAVRALAA
jgi:hypothetical protein